MKAKWISRPNYKTMGSLVIWLRSKGVVEKLLAAGQVLFGASGAYCSQYEHRDSPGPCFNCSTYGHRQANCRRKPKCGVCSQEHATRACTNHDDPHCPVCAGKHTVFDRACPLHPRHVKSPAKKATLPPPTGLGPPSAPLSSLRTETPQPATSPAHVQTPSNIPRPRTSEPSPPTWDEMVIENTPVLEC